MIEINARKNGIHSLVAGLKAFQIFENNPEDVFSLKDSILRSHHALETLFKDVLYRRNPILLVDEEIKVKNFLEGYIKFSKGELATELDELKTANLEEIIERLRRINLLTVLDNKEYALFLDSVKKLTFYRNRIQHFSLSADPDKVGGILGIVVPRAVDLLEEIPSYHPMFGDLLQVSIKAELKRDYPDVLPIIDRLRVNYDRLIRETVEFFKTRTFNDQVLKLKIEDYGKVGAPPYFPNLLSKGFLNLEYNRLHWKGLNFLPQIQEELPYVAKVQISQPVFTETQTLASESKVKGTFCFDAEITLDKASGILILPNVEDKIAILRGVNINIRAFLEYTAQSSKSEYHLDIGKILEANGELNIAFSAIPKGYESIDTEIIGKYE